MSEPAVGPRASRREWLGLAVLALPCLLYSMDMTVMHLALPQLSADLKPSSSELLWIVDIYGFLLAGFLITMGSLGDRVGRRRLLLIGATAFSMASALAAFSGSVGMLILARGLLGVAGATLAPSTLALIRNLFHDERQRSLAIGIWMTSYSVGSAIGPLVGGLLLQHFRWNAVFLIGVPLMPLLLVLGPRWLPEFRNPQAGRIDWASALGSIATVLSLVYALKRLAESGPDAVVGCALALGLLLAAGFVRRQRRLPEPLMDFKLFRQPAFSAALAAYALGCFAVLGMLLFVSQYLQLVLGMAPLTAGLWTLPSTAGFVFGAMASPALSKRFDPAWLMSGGLSLAAIGFVLLANAGAGGLPWVTLATVVFAAGLSVVFTLANDLVVGSAPPQQAGTASSISETGAELGGAMGIALLGSLAAALYRTGLPAAALPATDGSAAAWQAAGSSLGAALSLAEGLSAEAGEVLRLAARSAFLQAWAHTSLAAAALMLAMALVMAWSAWQAGRPWRREGLPVR